MDASLTCRHGRSVEELPQCLFQFVSLLPLDKVLETVELLQDRGGVASGGDAAQKVIHRPRQGRALVGTQRGCKPKGHL